MQERLAANPEVVLRQDVEGALLFNPHTGSVLLLNEVGVFIYALLDGHHTRQQIVDLLVIEYDVTAREAEQDLDEFLARLEEGQLVGEIG